MAVPNKPSTEGAARYDKWTQHCLDRASRRALTWVYLGVLAFIGQLVLVFEVGTSSVLPVVLLLASAVVFGFALRRRPPIGMILADEPWNQVQIRWDGRLVVVSGTRPIVLAVQGLGPVLRGRIRRHRRAWLVDPDNAGNTVIAFRGVPRLFHAKVLTRVFG
ncbi:hypothetical protein [Umezawaea sp. Da 62-37]|uniref:hypothetical protein n=1 Tax=Umezawaea sp. Da 62-37 TaxID=3075927 RepID=UPI0028F6C2DC|nr:hypothetical protein [Umezawaea sp. Da 62-37]WNV91529.1 hypothetical protein RM788_25705 [Umezawaea sp. Da 62-37]